jgi:dTDP-4-amino-4,6-dideoxygalactose transaminase
MKKTSLEDLAVFGGIPAFDQYFHVGRPNIGNRQMLMHRFNDILDRRWLTNNGIFVQELESRVAETLGVKHCVTTCNGTLAQMIGIKSLGLTGEVIVPSFTFIATAHALRWQSITPIFCDIDPKTHNIHPGQIENLITPRTSGIVCTHLWGRPCNVTDLTKIARRHNLKLMFDASHAFACSHLGRMVGGFGNAEFFSFHATKFVNTFEGGAITTNEDDLAEKLRLTKNFGFIGMDNVACIGINAKMNELSAAMGLSSLESMQDFIDINYRNYRQYLKELADLPGVCLVTYDESEKCNYQYIVAEIDETITGISRDNLVKVLHAEKVLSRRYFYPGCHNAEPYRSYFFRSSRLLPQTECLVEKVMTLPTGTAIEKDDISKICDVIHFTVAHGKEITRRLSVETAGTINAEPCLKIP